MTASPSIASPRATSTLDSINPATGDVVGRVPVTPPAEVADVVSRARKAAVAWSAMTPKERAEPLRRAGLDLVAEAASIGEVLTREMGKPLSEGVGEVNACGASMPSKTAEIIEALAPEDRVDEHTASQIHFDPFGVCAAITPWNFPISMPHSLVVPALMAGNTVVLKPSEETPLTAQAYVDVLNRHLPAGVLQVIHGADEQGKSLVASDVDIIAFTGSREVGAKILSAAGHGLKRVVLELGGKDPLIVLDGADIEAAAQFAVRNSFRNAGQVCVSTERIYVEDSIADEFESVFMRLTGEQAVGNGLKDGTTIGPMINGGQRDHVLRQVKAAIDDGAAVPSGSIEGDGNFLHPIVLTNVDHSMEIMREETFGPVACIMRVKSDEEAVQLANDTPFGLGAAVYGPEERAAAAARKLRAGMIGVNRSCGGASGSPWVGAQQSGYGYHGGRDGHRQFTQTRVVSRPRNTNA